MLQDLRTEVVDVLRRVAESYGWGGDGRIISSIRYWRFLLWRHALLMPYPSPMFRLDEPSSISYSLGPSPKPLFICLGITYTCANIHMRSH